MSIQTLTVSTPGPQGPSNGTVTVGNGTTHVGNYNASSYSGDASLAIEAALAASKRVALLPCVLTCATPVDIATDDSTIEGYGATLRPTSATTSTGQLFDITGDGVRIMGGRVELTQFTESQYVIRSNGADEFLIADLIVDDQVTPGSYTNPMVLFRADGCNSGTYRSNHVMPGKGLQVYYGRNCYALRIDDPMTGERWIDERLCDAVYTFNDCTHSLIRGGYAFGLGSAATKLNFVLRAFNTSNSVHHVRIDGGYYETILASRGFQVEGGRHAEFENMSVASFTETDVGVFCAVGSTGDATGTGVTNFELVNVKSHDNCKVGTNGALLYTRKATRVSMDAVRHVEAYSRLLRADTTNTDTLSLNNVRAHSTTAAASWSGGQDAAAYIGSATVTNWRFRNCKAYGSGADGFQAFHTTPPTGLDADDVA